MLSAAVAGADPLLAQERPIVVRPVQILPYRGPNRIQQPVRPAPVVRMAALGFLGGAVAGTAVAIPFYLALDDSGCEVCTGLIIAVPAVVVAYSAGQALGVHLGNGRRGTFLADLGISLLATAAGAGLGALADPDAAILGAAVGLAGTVWMEIRTSR
jgi:hypothetical protein